jgi:GTP 3',8-cyclase
VKWKPLADRYGRKITYLRISLTELCNFQCVYCVPPEGFKVRPPRESLLKSEIVRLVTLMGYLGVERVRLTGGEPLLRQDILDIIRALKSVPTVKDLSITTNGSKLAPVIPSLKEAGLDRINISLDSMDPKRFLKMTRSNSYEQVLNATFSALRAGFPVKLNMVAVKGLTREEIIKFVSLAREFPLEVRFLEFMPLCGTGWDDSYFLPIRDVRSIIQEHFNLIPEGSRQDQVAETFKIEGGQGKVGLIASLTESFCDTCSRIRLSADGNLFPCLFSNVHIPIRDLLRNQASDQVLIDAIRKAAWMKPAGNQFHEKPYRSGEENFVNVKASPLIHHIGG